jgi:hypothetical protein
MNSAASESRLSHLKPLPWLAEDVLARNSAVTESKITMNSGADFTEHAHGGISDHLESW